MTVTCHDIRVTCPSWSGVLQGQYEFRENTLKGDLSLDCLMYPGKEHRQPRTEQQQHRRVVGVRPKHTGPNQSEAVMWCLDFSKALDTVLHDIFVWIREIWCQVNNLQLWAIYDLIQPMGLGWSLVAFLQGGTLPIWWQHRQGKQGWWQQHKLG